MKKFRKGFTLLELLVVIGVIGIMSSTAMIAGQQATDAARATNIADSLEKAASAMMMYYSDNADDIAVNGVVETDVVEGANAYLKKTAHLIDSKATNFIGKYTVYIIGETPAAQTWWISYTLPDNDKAGVGPIMKNKAERMGLKIDVADTADNYDGTQKEICMKVR